MILKRPLLALGKTVLLFALFLAVQLLASIVMMVMNQGRPGLAGSPFHIAQNALVVASLAILLYWLVQTKLDRRPWSETGLGLTRTTPKHLGLGAGIAVALSVAIFAVLYAVGAAKPVAVLPGTQGWGYTSALVAAGVLSGLSIGLIEEGLFRGYLIPYYTRHFGYGPAVVISAVVFSAAHLLQPDYRLATVVIEVALTGLVLALMWRCHGTLWVAVGFHAAWDFVQLYLLPWDVDSHAVSGSVAVLRRTAPSWMTEVSLFGKEGSAPEFVLIIGMALLYLYLVRTAAPGRQD